MTSYDDIPYATRPMYPCHPDCLATVGVLLGMSPAPLERCRMLEIGCASAGNLIPIAMQFPGSQFVGVDLSPVQIAAGQSVVRDLEIVNLDLRAQSVMDIGPAWGQFDYIVCHGVFSWVPGTVREKILQICRDNLSTHGIAYISYNTYPGWYARKTLRDVLNLHVARFPDAATKVSQAREFLEFLDKFGLSPDSPSAAAIRELIADLREQPDYYLFHEYLETENQPFYFADFMKLATAHGLQYMGNAFHHIGLDMLKPEAKKMLLDISEDLVQLEQFYDFLSDRPFRRSLLCHANLPLDRSPSPELMSRLHVGALASPASRTPDCYSDAPETFVVDGKKRGTTDQPLVKTMFTTLAEIWPRTASFDALWTTIRDRLAAHDCLGRELAEDGRAILAQHLIQAYLGNFVSLHVEPFSFALTPGDRPRASRLAHWQHAHDAPRLSTLRHMSVTPEPMDRIVLPLCDGSRTAEQVMESIAGRVADGKLSITGEDGQPLTGEMLERAIRKTVDESLTRLGRQCLLEA